MTLDPDAVNAALDAQASGDPMPLAALVQAHPDARGPRIEHLRGVLACARGDLAAGTIHLQRAMQEAPADDRIAGDLAKALFAQRRLEDAVTVNAKARALSPTRAEHHVFHGHIELSQGRIEQALPAFAQAARLQPDDVATWRLLARSAHHLRRFQEAEPAYRHVLALEPGDVDARIELATLYNATGRPSEALAALPQLPLPQACLQRAVALQALGDYAGAEQNAHSGLQLAPDDAELKRMRGVALQHLHRHDEAAPLLLDAMRARFAPSPPRPSRLPEHLRYSRAKLLHDIEQLEYLLRTRALPTADALIAGHRQLLASIPHDVPDTALLDIPTPLQPLAHKMYNRLHHWVDAPRIATGALRERDDAEAIQDQYLSQPPGILAIDGLLSDQALASLRRHCLESTLWFDFNHPNGYLGATFENGFAPQLLLQLVEELRTRFPLIFRDYPLTQLWAFKYDSRQEGIELHADIAAVNLNFWITPDESNLDPGCGGLVVWDKEAPQSWRFDEFNSRAAQARIADFLASEGAREVRIPYRCNRAVLFNSDLFHRTDSIRFKTGYENRRINITMLFGYRQQAD